MLSDTENRKVGKIVLCEDYIDIDGRVIYNVIELKTGEDVKDKWRSFRRRLTNGPIELDSKIWRSVDDIMKMMKCPESFGSVLVFLSITLFLSYV